MAMCRPVLIHVGARGNEADSSANSSEPELRLRNYCLSVVQILVLIVFYIGLIENKF